MEHLSESVQRLEMLYQRDTPKKPSIRELALGAMVSECPICGWFLLYVDESKLERMKTHLGYRFCDACGQRLDWS